MARDPKTPTQLHREIAYYRRVLQFSKSAEKLHRARRAIVVRTRELEAAERVQKASR